MIRKASHRPAGQSGRSNAVVTAGILLVAALLAASCGSGSDGQSAAESTSTTTSYTTIPNVGAPEGPLVKSLESSCLTPSGAHLTAPAGYGFDPDAVGPAACVFMQRTDGIGDTRAVRINGFKSGTEWQAAILAVMPFMGLATEFDAAAVPSIPLSKSLTIDAVTASAVSKADPTDTTNGTSAFVAAGVRTTLTQFSPETIGDPTVTVVVVFADGSGAVMALVNGGAPSIGADLSALRSLIATAEPSA